MSMRGDPFWKGLVRPDGRSDRIRFWMVIGLIQAAFLACGALVDLIGATMGAAIPALILTAAAFVVGTINAVRRLHDMGRSGWWLLLMLVLLMTGAMAFAMDASPLTFFGAGAAVLVAAGGLIFLGSVPGQKDTNRYGA